MRPSPHPVMTIPLRLLLPAAILAAGLIGVLAVLAVRGDAAPVGGARATGVRVPAGPPIATVPGTAPGTTLTLLELRRTGPKVVTARLRIAYHGPRDRLFVPRDGAVGPWWSAADMRLVDETNRREHFVLRNADGECLCTGRLEPLADGRSSVISAKFPAPPPGVRDASLQTPGFASFDAVPLS
jgi:hypothetical protein